MTRDFHELLKESGYLDTPVNRFFWKNASPTLRNHLRQWLILSLSTALPFAALLASLSQLKGMDRLTLFVFYTVVYCSGFALLDIATGFLMRVVGDVREESPWLNWVPIPLAMLFLFFWTRGLENAIDVRPTEVRVLIWAALALSCWIAGKSCQLLVISRLYWHGIRPPKLRQYPLLTGLVLASMITLHLVQQVTPQLPHLEPNGGTPMVVLALDVPHGLFKDYTQLFPDWPAQDFEVEENDITNFWTELGTGTNSSLHQTSLVVFKTPLFTSPLNRRDPTQGAPLFVFQTLGLSSPVSEGGRFRQYFWEILDNYQLRTYAYSWWHSYPASSRNGGVLSERWTHEQQGYPFEVGLKILDPKQEAPVSQNKALEATRNREKQTWAQLLERARLSDFDLCVAYLPLADLMANTEQEGLLLYRKEMITQLLGSLPRDTRMGILLSSGKPDGNVLQYRFITNWLQSVADPLENHLELAPTILHAYELPPDQLMARSRIKIPLDIPIERVDYGEPEQDRIPDPRSDQNYYEELRSLGYVK